MKPRRNKGKFVGGYVGSEHFEKLTEVEAYIDEHFGEPGRNRSRALRYILDCFDPANLVYFPKNQAIVS